MQDIDLLQRRLLHPRERLRQRQALLQQLAQRMSSAAAQQLERRAWQVHQAGLHWQREAPALGERAHRLARLRTRLATHTARELAAHAAHLRTLASNLDHLNPQAVLERGYSIARNAAGAIVRTASQLSERQKLSLQFARGGAEVVVERKRDDG
jgi:exodeoxyribonuclease VII large subunit